MVQQNKKSPLAGRVILVPPARPEANPLLKILEKAGAKPIEFPRLEVAPPADFSPMDEAIRELPFFNWLVFSGSNCVVNFLGRMENADCKIPDEMRLAAIGTGAAGKLRQAGFRPDYIPRQHTAAAVTGGFGKVAGLRFLLIRVAGASRALPEKLQELGADIREIAGYRMLVRADRKTAERVFASRPHAVALPNPSAVRFLLQGLAQAGLQPAEALRDIPVVAVGPATARAARTSGLSPTVTSQGHIADLAATLIALLT
ncbi:MAG: uroporphyrinogen-III synthase [Deltaproteobacteria bacterium]|jgi:uroporphyrinogen-III synthase